jgi:hypothetical protein
MACSVLKPSACTGQMKEAPAADCRSSDAMYPTAAKARGALGN